MSRNQQVGRARLSSAVSSTNMYYRGRFIPASLSRIQQVTLRPKIAPKPYIVWYLCLRYEALEPQGFTIIGIGSDASCEQASPMRLGTRVGLDCCPAFNNSFAMLTDPKIMQALAFRGLQCRTPAVSCHPHASRVGASVKDRCHEPQNLKVTYARDGSTPAFKIQDLAAAFRLWMGPVLPVVALR